MTAKNISDVLVLAAENGVLKRTVVTTDFQVGYPGQPGELHITGRLSQSVKVLNAEPKKSYSLDDTCTVVCVITKTGAPGDVTITLPTTPRTGQTLYIKDTSGTAATNNLTLTSQNGTIDGVKSKTISTSFDCYNVVWTGSSWVSIAGAGTPGANGSNISTFYFSGDSLGTYYNSVYGYSGFLFQGGGATGALPDADLSNSPVPGYIGTPVPYSCRLTSFSVSHSIDSMPEDLTYKVYVNGFHDTLAAQPFVNFDSKTTTRFLTWTGSLDLNAGDVVSVVEVSPPNLRPSSSPSISAAVTFRQI